MLAVKWLVRFFRTSPQTAGNGLLVRGTLLRCSFLEADVHEIHSRAQAAKMSTDERLDELAAILAKGMQRLKGRPGKSGVETRSSDETSPKSRPPSLELSRTARLTVTP